MNPAPQNYLEPLHQLQSKDLKEVAHHRKKLQGRKLDYDCKKRKQQGAGGIPDKEIKQVTLTSPDSPSLLIS